MYQNFITNIPNTTNLNDRLHTLIKHSEELKFLVGFFYFSGWSELYEALKERDDLPIKILVGLDTDMYFDRVIEVANSTSAIASQQEKVNRFYTSLGHALRDVALDTEEATEQVSYFLNLLKEGRLQIRKTSTPNHAKLYLFKMKQPGREITNMPGRFITGSSNLTRAGLHRQYEFNVEIGDYGWAEAEAWFDNLWEDAILLSEETERKKTILQIIREQSPFATITPFEAYAFLLKTWIDLAKHKSLSRHSKELMTRRGYHIYKYQEEAVQQALTVLEEYGGVILADVVGLGKSVIASWLAREHGGRGIVICPPALMGNSQTRSSGWYKYLGDFELYDWEVFSLGSLDKALEYLDQYGDDIKTIIVDEAHRFRNEDSEAYEQLSQICFNRSVILLTATPFNNAPSDIFSLLKLFIPPGKSTLTLDEKLSARFARYNSEFRKLSYISRYHNARGEKKRRAERYYQEIFETNSLIQVHRVKARAKSLSKKIRSVIEPVVIRRNRLDLKRDPVYKNEVTDLSDIKDPIELFYELTPDQSILYDKVLNEYFGETGCFKGAIYQPYAYEKQNLGKKLDEDFTYQQQRNLFEFMRRLLVKRFESSFGAFDQSIQNFIRVHEQVLKFIEKSRRRYVLDRRLIEKYHQADPDEIDVALNQFLQTLRNQDPSLNPRHDRIYEINKFHNPDGFIKDIESDLTLLRDIKQQINQLKLVENDPKATRLIEAIKNVLDANPKQGEPKRKVVIFTEYQDTVKHVSPWLEKAFPKRLLVASGNLGDSFFKKLLSNFDASYPSEKQRDNYDIIIATDKLSEGVNLNRAGAIFNYDIPWNPTRVIQRVGRINRIGKKVFQELHIYNFFPTEQGADVIKSREIAAQKMFLIHHTLGEDAKILSPDEDPSPSLLYDRLNANPDEFEKESFFTAVRQKFLKIAEQHPEVVKKLENFPTRVKTAKAFDKNELLVFIQKGLQIFVHTVPNTAVTDKDSLEVKPISFEDALLHVQCNKEEKTLPLSKYFWPAYEAIKKYREFTSIPQSEQSLMRKAENNLRSALQHHASALGDNYTSFIDMVLRDLREYQILPKYSLRRLAKVEMKENAPKKDIEAFKKELDTLKRVLGHDYLDRIEKKLKKFKSEIIVSVENINQLEKPMTEAVQESTQ